MKLHQFEGQYGIIRDIAQAPGLIRRYNADDARMLIKALTATRESKHRPRLLPVGFGSSSHLPTDAVGVHQRFRPPSVDVVRCDPLQLNPTLVQRGDIVLAISNSGKTAGLVKLFDALQNRREQLYALVCGEHEGPIASLTHQSYHLQRRPELADAATVSVMESMKFMDIVLDELARPYEPQIGTSHDGSIANALEHVLDLDIDEAIIEKIVAAECVYIASPTKGLTAELTLKFWELLGKKAIPVPGIELLHGVEETMRAGDLILWFDPPVNAWDTAVEKFYDTSPNVEIIAITAMSAPFTRVEVPSSAFQKYVLLAAGWVLLTLAGIRAGRDVDHMVRGQKIGDEYRGTK